MPSSNIPDLHSFPTRRSSDLDELPTTYEDLAKDVRVGAKILLNDGLLSVEVTRVVPPRVEGRVVDGGTLTSHKGMNLPGLHVSARSEEHTSELQSHVNLVCRPPTSQIYTLSLHDALPI